MIGYYVHHVGQGHAHRAAAIAAALPEPVTALSSLPRPSYWTQEWIELPSDEVNSPRNPTAGGVFHWVPRRCAGLSKRMAALGAWLADNQPLVFVSDLSVEVTVLARLLGIPVVTTTLPGDRTDRAHKLGYEVADAILAPWPCLDRSMSAGLEDFGAKTYFIGGLSRFDCQVGAASAPVVEGRVLALNGAGGRDLIGPGGGVGRWEWLQRDRDHWTDNLWPDLCSAEVIVSHCGLGAISDVAAARKPAVLLAQDRPHDEQYCTARALGRRGLGVALVKPPDPRSWPDVLERALTAFDPDGWTAWSSGEGASRAAEVVMSVAMSA